MKLQVLKEMLIKWSRTFSQSPMLTVYILNYFDESQMYTCFALTKHTLNENEELDMYNQ